MAIDYRGAISGAAAGRPMPTSRWGIPSWAGSIVFHGLVLVVVLLLWGMAPQRPQPPGERTANNVGIVLAHQKEDGTEVFETEDSDGEQESMHEARSETMPSLAEAFDQQGPPLDPTEHLPSPPTIGMTARDNPGGITAAGALGGPSGQGDTSGAGARVGFLGVEGEGSRFVYVIDRSESMRDYGEAPLRLAKRALVESLGSLGPTHQFQIVFFNETPSVFNPASGGRLPLASDQNKRVAERFIGTITPGGGTDHEAALMRAIALQPDVIFFLTDAGEPQMSKAALYRVRSKAASSIHVVEFGRGPAPGGYNFLRRLADENNGQYSYVDITKHLGGS